MDEDQEWRYRGDVRWQFGPQIHDHNNHYYHKGV